MQSEDYCRISLPLNYFTFSDTIIYRVLKKSCRKIIANFFKNMGDSDFLSLLGAPQMWSI